MHTGGTARLQLGCNVVLVLRKTHQAGKGLGNPQPGLLPSRPFSRPPSTSRRSLSVMEDRNNIHWRSPLLIVGFWVLGILLYVGHDQFYASLSGTTATDQQYRVLGSRHSEQQFNLAIGTGIAFLARASFSLTASTSYFQMSWLSLRRAKPGQRTATLEVIDTVFSATSNVFAFAYAPVWVRKPLLFQVALTIW